MSDENKMQEETPNNFVSLNSFRDHQCQRVNQNHYVEEMKAMVIIKDVNLEDREAYESDLSDISEIIRDDKGEILKVKTQNQRALLIHHSVVDEQDEYIFKNFEQCKKQLNKLRTQTIIDLWEACAELNGLSNKATKEAEKKSEEEADNSSTNSPAKED